MSLAMLLHGQRKCQNQRGVGQQWKQTEEVSGVSVYTISLSSGCQERLLRPATHLVPAGPVDPVMRWVHMTGVIKFLTPVTPFVLIPCPLTIIGLPK